MMMTRGTRRSQDSNGVMSALQWGPAETNGPMAAYGSTGTAQSDGQIGENHHPGHNITTILDYSLNQQKALKQKAESLKTPYDICIANTQGGVRILFNTVVYELLKEVTPAILDKKRLYTCTVDHKSDRNKACVSSSSKMVHSLSPSLNYTVNLYHTTSSALVNGKSPSKFVDDDLIQICSKIKGTFNGSSFNLDSIRFMLQTKLTEALNSFKLAANRPSRSTAPSSNHIPDARELRANPLAVDTQMVDRMDNQADGSQGGTLARVMEQLSLGEPPAVSTQGASLVNNIVITTSSSSSHMSTVSSIPSTIPALSAPGGTILSTGRSSPILAVGSSVTNSGLSPLTHPPVSHANPISIPISIDASMYNQLLPGNRSVSAPIDPATVRQLLANNLSAGNAQSLATPIAGMLPAQHVTSAPAQLPPSNQVASAAINAVSMPAVSSPAGGLPQPGGPLPITSHLGSPQLNQESTQHLTDTLTMAESRIKKLQTRVAQMEAELAFKANQHKAEQKRYTQLETQLTEAQQTIKLLRDTVATQDEKIKSLEASAASRPPPPPTSNPPYYPYPPPPGHYPYPPPNPYPYPSQYPQPAHHCCQSSQGTNQALLELLVKELCASRHTSQPHQVPPPVYPPQVVPMPMPMPVYMPPIPTVNNHPKGQGKPRPKGAPPKTQAPPRQDTNVGSPLTSHTVPIPTNSNANQTGTASAPSASSSTQPKGASTPQSASAVTPGQSPTQEGLSPRQEDSNSRSSAHFLPQTPPHPRPPNN